MNFVKFLSFALLISVFFCGIVNAQPVTAPVRSEYLRVESVDPVCTVKLFYPLNISDLTKAQVATGAWQLTSCLQKAWTAATTELAREVQGGIEPAAVARRVYVELSASADLNRFAGADDEADVRLQVTLAWARAVRVLNVLRDRGVERVVAIPATYTPDGERYVLIKVWSGPPDRTVAPDDRYPLKTDLSDLADRFEVVKADVADLKRDVADLKAAPPPASPFAFRWTLGVRLYGGEHAKLGMGLDGVGGFRLTTAGGKVFALRGFVGTAGRLAFGLEALGGKELTPDGKIALLGGVGGRIFGYHDEPEEMVDGSTRFFGDAVSQSIYGLGELQWLPGEKKWVLSATLQIGRGLNDGSEPGFSNTEPWVFWTAGLGAHRLF